MALVTAEVKLPKVLPQTVLHPEKGCVVNGRTGKGKHQRFKAPQPPRRSDALVPTLLECEGLWS